MQVCLSVKCFTVMSEAESIVEASVACESKHNRFFSSAHAKVTHWIAVFAAVFLVDVLETEILRHIRGEHLHISFSKSFSEADPSASREWGIGM